MMKIYFKNILFVFLLCFSCFIAGWLTAISIFPRNLLQQNTKKEIKTEDKKMPFFEEMRNNILILFNPYKMDSLMKKNTHLENEENYIKKQKKTLPINYKTSQNSKKLSKELNKQKTPQESFLKKTNSLASQAKNKTDEETLKKQKNKYDEKNREQLLQILADQNFFTIDGNFSFLINIFSEEEKALDYIKSMKEQFPLWSFLIKEHKDHFRIYLGPFSSKQKALKFKKTIPYPIPFSHSFLEEVSI